MKAPPPRLWTPAISIHAPWSQALAVAVLGGTGLTLAVTSDSNDVVKDGDGYCGRTSINTDNAPDTDTSASVRPNFVIRKLLISSSVNRTTMPTSHTILATSQNKRLATSDASAKRSPALPASARLSGGKSSSSLSANTPDNIVQDDPPADTVSCAPYELERNEDATPQQRRVLGRNNEETPAHEIYIQSVQHQSNSTNANSELSSYSQSPMTSHDDSYPTFTPYHQSLLKKYLTPKVWSKLSRLSTSYGTTIEDIIRAGLALPIGANPPRRVGVLVGDEECYKVFKELLDPIISEYHGIKCYEEWMDPELPMEQYFKEKGAPAAGTSSISSDTTKKSVSAIPPVGKDDDVEYGVIKSSGADEDSDTNDDSSFLLGEEDDVFVEYIAMQPSAPPPLSSPPPPPLSAKNNDSQPPPSTSTNNVAAIASKRKGNLRRHPTIINNPRLVTNREADPEGKYIVSTRIRVARNIANVRFPTTMSRSDRRHVQRLVDQCTRFFHTPQLADGTYLPVLSMTNDQNLDLIERHVLFDNPNEWTIASGLGRDWPDGRALYANVDDLRTHTPDFMIWVNEEDHLRIMCLRSGGDIQGVFTTLMNGVRELERELRKRGSQFAYDSRLGYLTSCPTNVGTTMRASVHVQLTELGRLPGFFELVQRLKLEVRGKYGETDRHYTGVFDISNAERLGKSEVHLINVMVEGVAKLIELERKLEAGEMVDISEIADE